MIMRKMVFSGIFAFALLGCQAGGEAPSSTVPSAPLSDQAQLEALLLKAGVENLDRSLVHVSHTCNLLIDDEKFPVIDMRELVKGAMSARGVNNVVVLDSNYQLIQKIEYGQSRPLFCEANKLYLYNDIILDNQTEEGKVLQCQCQRVEKLAINSQKGECNAHIAEENHTE